MFKKIILCLLLSSPVCAQEVFWGFDDMNKEMFVPAECDSTFDPDELYELGMRFLNETGYVQQGAGYCMIASAFLGNVDAQYQVGWMYHRGVALPKSDLAAYKWASLAAFQGNQEADQLAVSMEQFLSVEDMEQSTAFLNETLRMFNARNERQMEKDSARVLELEAQIAQLKKDVLDLNLYGELQSVQVSDPAPLPEMAENMPEKKEGAPRTERAGKHEPIFGQKDLEEAPMPKSAPKK